MLINMFDLNLLMTGYHCLLIAILYYLTLKFAKGKEMKEEKHREKDRIKLRNPSGHALHIVFVSFILVFVAFSRKKTPRPLTIIALWLLLNYVFGNLDLCYLLLKFPHFLPF